MPIESVSRIMSRIRKSPPDQGISVFVVKKGKTLVLDAIYANTIEAKRRQTALKPYHPSDKCPTCGHIDLKPAENWIGDFNNTMVMKDVRNFLLTATET